MLIFDDIYSWEGWGGKLRLASGKCRLRIHDLSREDSKGMSHLRPVIVIVSDIPDNKMSVKSCAGHIATKVTEDFKIDPDRMLWIEYYPESEYGENKTHIIPEKYEAVEFTWQDGKALNPKWRLLKPPLSDRIKALIK